MSTQYVQLNSALGVDRSTFFDDKLLLRLLSEIDLRLSHLYGLEDSLTSATTLVRQVALDRINEVLTPAIQSVINIQERGYLIARSDSSGTLGNGNVLTLVVDDEDERAVFTPSPFTALTREDNPDDYGIARTISYDNVTGQYLCEVLSFEGDPGPHTDWVIGALAGSTAAQYAMIDDMTEARDAAITAKDDAIDAKNASLITANASAASANLAEEKATVATDKATITTTQAGIATTAAGVAVAAANAAAATANEIEAMLETGAVVSVNGRTGIVTGLAEAADVYTKTAADALLSAKAAASAVYTKTEADALLLAKAAASAVYTKTEADALLLAKAAASAVYTKTEADALLAAKAVASTTYSKTEVDTAIAAINIGTNTFVAQGSIATGDRVALRSDGKVEVVTGSETLPAVGAAQTLTITTSVKKAIIAAAYNATVAKVAVLYFNGGTCYVVIGTVSGTVITFGTPFSVGTGYDSSVNGYVVWNAAGTKFCIAYKSSGTIGVIVSYSLSGTTPTTVTTKGAAFSFATSTNEITGLFIDETAGLLVGLSAEGSYKMSYNTSTASLGSTNNLSVSVGNGSLVIFDAASTRFFVVSWVLSFNVRACNYNAGSNNATSAGAATGGASAAFTPDGELVVVANGDATTGPMAHVCTFSGVTVTINTGYSVVPSPAFVATKASNSKCVYDATSGKVVMAIATGKGDAYGGLFIRVCDPSSTYFNPVSSLKINLDNFDAADLLDMVRFSDGVIAIRYRDQENFGTRTTLYGHVSGNNFVITDTMVLSEDIWAVELPLVPVITGHSFIRAGRVVQSGTLLDFQMERVGEFSTNADACVGVATATVTNGQNVPVTLMGGIVTVVGGGLTVGQKYYMAANGNLQTTDNGRFFGTAISSTKIQTAAKAT